MNITIETYLFAPAERKFFGGTNPSIMQKEESIELILTPEVFEKLLTGTYTHQGHSVLRYSKKHNRLYLTGNMSSLEDAYIKKMVKEGWVLNEKALASYQY